MNESQNASLALTTIDDYTKVGGILAASQMFGVRNPEQGAALLMLCQAEGVNPFQAIRRYHMIEGRPSMRADAMQGEFQRTGAVFWHVHADYEVSASFFLDKETMKDPEAIKRAQSRYLLLRRIETLADTDKWEATEQLVNLSRPGEATIIRTFQDALDKGLALSPKMDISGNPVIKAVWAKNPRAMLAARCVSEGIRLINPGIIAGIYTPEEAEEIAQERVLQIDTSAQDAIDRKEQLQLQAKAAVEAAAQVRAEEAGELGVKVTADNWPALKCHFGKANGPYLGKTLGEIFVQTKYTQARKLYAYINEKFSNPLIEKRGMFGDANVPAQDIALLTGLGFALLHIQEREKTEAPKEAAPEPSLTPEGAQQAAPKPPAVSGQPAEEKPASTEVLAPSHPAPEKTVTDMRLAGPQEIKTWREAVLPWSKSAGMTLGEICAKGGWEKLEAVGPVVIDKQKPPFTKEQNYFIAQYALAREELKLDESKPLIALLESLRSRIDDLLVTEETFVQFMIECGALNKLESVKAGHHLANYECDTLRKLVIQWPDITTSVVQSNQPRIDPSKRKGAKKK